jgi:hypothetical protein
MEQWKCSKFDKANKWNVSGTTTIHPTFAEANHRATEILNDLGDLGRNIYSVMLEPIIV